MGEMNHCSAIYLNHLEEALLINEWEFAEFAEAGIVDKQVDFNSFFSRESIDPFPSRRIGQIGGEKLFSGFFRRGRPLRGRPQAGFLGGRPPKKRFSLFPVPPHSHT